MAAVEYRLAIRSAHLPDHLANKSRSTISWPTLAWVFSTPAYVGLRPLYPPRRQRPALPASATASPWRKSAWNELHSAGQGPSRSPALAVRSRRSSPSAPCQYSVSSSSSLSAPLTNGTTGFPIILMVPIRGPLQRPLRKLRQ